MNFSQPSSSRSLIVTLQPPPLLLGALYHPAFCDGPPYGSLTTLNTGSQSPYGLHPLPVHLTPRSFLSVPSGMYTSSTPKVLTFNFCEDDSKIQNSFHCHAPIPDGQLPPTHLCLEAAPSPQSQHLQRGGLHLTPNLLLLLTPGLFMEPASCFFSWSLRIVSDATLSFSHHIPSTCKCSVSTSTASSASISSFSFPRAAPRPSPHHLG